MLLGPGDSCYRPRRDGQRRRKSVRGCIVGPDLAVLSLAVEKKGAAEIVGLTDVQQPRRLAPKRANKIRKMYHLGKQDDVRKYVIHRTIQPKPLKEGEKAPAKPKKTQRVAPKIQRLITPQSLQRKRHLHAVRLDRLNRRRAQETTYKALLDKINKERSQGSGAAASGKPAPAPGKAVAAASAPAKPAAAGAAPAKPAKPASGAASKAKGSA